MKSIKKFYSKLFIYLICILSLIQLFPIIQEKSSKINDIFSKKRYFPGNNYAINYFIQNLPNIIDENAFIPIYADLLFVIFLLANVVLYVCIFNKKLQ